MNTGAGLEDIDFNYDQFEDEEAFAREIDLKLSLAKRFE
jgi:hypothetical protein